MKLTRKGWERGHGYKERTWGEIVTGYYPYLKKVQPTKTGAGRGIGGFGARKGTKPANVGMEMEEQRGGGG